MSKQITFDEWIFHNFLEAKDNPQLLKKIFKFWLCFHQICDKFVYQKGTPLAHKLFKLFEEAKNANKLFSEVVNFFKSAIFFNSEKSAEISSTISIPENCLNILHHKDHYLLKIVLSTDDKILITSDLRLIEQIKKCNLKIETKQNDQFISEYLSQCNNNQ